MVDAIVSFAINRLGDYIIQEANFLGEVSRKLQWLRYDLNSMRAFLNDAEKKQDEDQRIRMWVSEIREIAFETEDVMDTYILKVKGVGIAKKRVLTSTKKFFSLSNKADHYDIGQKLEELEKRINGLAKKREVYGISNIDGAEGGTNLKLDMLHSLRKAASEDENEEEDFVGFENDIRSLEAELINNERRRRVISILGMGGLGKTTLAKKLYNKNKSMFHFHAWVCVSQVWGIRDLLQKLFSDLRMPLSRDELIEMSDYNMRRRLHEHLKGRSYLLVLDDVWERNAWESLRSALPDDNNGSKIIITTRIQGVAEVPNERTYLHRLQRLQEMQSCQLFCKKVFPNHNGGFHCPPNTEKLGREMVAKCGGLPLAISVLGEVLRRKQIHEWPAVKDQIWRELKNESIHIRWLFDLSYIHLPQELKPCILYLALFPEDFVIDTEKLIRLWVAEGILPPDNELDLEAQAEDFLKQLAGRSMIQVEKNNWRTIATCRVHDLLRDLAVNKARELSLFHVPDKIKSDPSSMASSYRKLGLRSGFIRYLDHSKPCVRTLLFFHSEINNSRSVMTKFKLLRVLDLKEINFCLEGNERLSEAIGELIHLRYLGLKDTNTDELRHAIRNLEFLQTLDASSELKMTLPNEICNLKQLRHLRGNFSVMPPMLCQELTNLQTLKIVEISTQEEGESALNPIAQLTSLKFVSVRSCVDIQLSIQPLLCCQHLLELRVHGRIANLPEMHESLPNLRYLELRDSKLEQDPMPKLEMLQYLMVLELSSIGIDIVTCTGTGFHHLQVLQLSDTIQVEMRVAGSAQPMPNLKALSMSDSARRALPERLSSLPAVDHLNWEWENIWQ